MTASARRRAVLRFDYLEDRTNPSPSVTPGGTAPTGLGYSFTNWPAEALSGITLTTENTFPVVGPSGQAIRATEDWIVRDPFPITDLDGNLAKIGGWYVVAGLATPRDDAVGTLREFRYIISADGVNWQEGGRLITSDDAGPGGLGDQLFSGDFRYDAANNRVLLYYTPVVGSNAAEYVQSPSGRHMRQEIAVAQATPNPTATGLTFTGFVQYGIELVPDGKWYVKPEVANTETEVYAFRDPFLFRDPETGKNFLLFAANWGTDQTIGYNGGVTGDQQFPDAGPMTVDPNLPRNDGVVGLAVATDDTLTNWTLLPPIFGGVGVNEQLELPHIIHENGLYYLLVSTHNRTFIGDLKYDYPEGFYGFVADDLQGPYRPLNGTSLIFSNPPQDELQNYGWKATDIGGGRATVTSFINKGNSGTISPQVTIRFDGDTAVIDQYQTPTGAGLPQPTVLAFGVTPTAAAGSITLPPPPVAAATPGDFTGDGTADVVIGAAAGGGPRVWVIDGETGATVRSFFAFGASFRGGVSVAVGDVTGDGFPDVVAGAGAGGGAHVKVFDGRTFEEVRSFFAYDASFRNGVAVAVGDVTGDDRADIITGTGIGGGPHVKVFDGATGAEVRSFMAYDDAFRGGVNVAVGDLDGDGDAEIVTAPGTGAPPQVRVFDAAGNRVRNFLAFDEGFAGGVYLAVGDLTGDGRDDILVGAGANGGPRVKAYDGRTGGEVASEFAYDPSFGGGVAVGVSGGRAVTVPQGIGPKAPPARLWDAATFDILAEYDLYGGPRV